jgi:hypothetical protein
MEDNMITYFTNDEGKVKFCPKINNLCRSDCAFLLKMRNLHSNEAYQICVYESMARDLDVLSDAALRFG